MPKARGDDTKAILDLERRIQRKPWQDGAWHVELVERLQRAGPVAKAVPEIPDTTGEGKDGTLLPSLPAVLERALLHFPQLPPLWEAWVWLAVEAEPILPEGAEPGPAPVLKRILDALAACPDPALLQRLLAAWLEAATADAEEEEGEGRMDEGADGEEESDDRHARAQRARNLALLERLPPTSILELVQRLEKATAPGPLSTLPFHFPASSPAGTCLMQTVLEIKTTLLSLASLLPPERTTGRGPYSPEGVRHAFLNQLAIPHAALDEIFSAYSSFETHVDPDQYTERMKRATTIVAQTKRYCWKREQLEDRLRAARTMDDAPKHVRRMLAEYLCWEKQAAAAKKSAASFGHPLLVLGLYERALLDFPQDQELWHGYLAYMSAHLLPTGGKLLQAAFERACRYLPGRALPYVHMMAAQECLNALHPQELSPVDAVYAQGYASISPMPAEQGALFVAWIAYCIRKVRREADQDGAPPTALPADRLEHLRSLCQECATLLDASGASGQGRKAAGNDAAPASPIWRVQLLVEWQLARDVERTRALYRKLLHAHPASTPLLLEYAHWEQSLPPDVTSAYGVRSAFKQALVRRMERQGEEEGELYNAYRALELAHGSIQDVLVAEDKICGRREMRQSKELSPEAPPGPAFPSTAEGETPSLKRQRLAEAESAPSTPTESMAMEQSQESATEHTVMPSSVNPSPEVGKPFSSAPLPKSEVSFADYKVVEYATAGSMLYLPHLPYATTHEHLEALFRPYGVLEDVVLRPDAQGELEALIEYRDAEAVKRAVAGSAGVQLLGVPLRPLRCRPAESLWAFQRSEELNKLYVSNLPDGVEKRVVREAFSRYGEILDMRIVRRAHHTFCYIQYRHVAEANKALALDGTTLPGATVRVGEDGQPQRLSVAISDPRRAVPKQANACELYVTNLPYAWVQEDVESLFGAYGALKGLHLLTHPKSGAFRGVAFVEYEQPEAARQALQEVNGRTVDGRILTVAQSDPSQRRKHVELERKLEVHERAATRAKTLFVPRATTARRGGASRRPMLDVSSARAGTGPVTSSDAPAAGGGGLSQKDFRQLLARGQPPQ